MTFYVSSARYLDKIPIFLLLYVTLITSVLSVIILLFFNNEFSYLDLRLNFYSYYHFHYYH